MLHEDQSNRSYINGAWLAMLSSCFHGATKDFRFINVPRLDLCVLNMQQYCFSGVGVQPEVLDWDQ